MATIQAIQTKKRGVQYRAIIRISGYPRRSGTFKTMRDARTWTARLEADMRTGKYQDDAAAYVYTAGEMIERYLEHVLPVKSRKPRYLEGQKHQLLWWKQQIGAYRLSTLTPFILSECRDRLHSGGRKHATVNRYLAALNHVFTTAVKEWGWLQSNPLQKVRKLSEPRGRVRFLSVDERVRLLEACLAVPQKPLCQLVVLALATGARKGELLGIMCKDVDLERKCISIHDTKNGESRRLSLSSAALALVAERMEAKHHRQVYLFEHPRTHRPYEMDDAWDFARKRAGLPDFRFHDLRHTFASYMAMNGASLAEIAEALGHKTLNMVKRYAHLSESHTSAVIREMCHTYLLSAKTGAQEAMAAT
jgi:integrase